jgi:phage tail-like protein
MKHTEIQRFLPGVFQRTVQRGTPLYALLEVMEALHEPSEQVLQRLDETFDPRRTTDEMVPYLARWLDLDRLLARAPEARLASRSFGEPLPSGLGRLRELVANAAYLSQWRGTAKGLLFFLQTATGVEGFEIREGVASPGGLPRPFHIQVFVPEPATPYRPLIEKIVEQEKPAYVTYELAFAETIPGGT